MHTLHTHTHTCTHTHIHMHTHTHMHTHMHMHMHHFQYSSTLHPQSYFSPHNYVVVPARRKLLGFLLFQLPYSLIPALPTSCTPPTHRPLTDPGRSVQDAVDDLNTLAALNPIRPYFLAVHVREFSTVGKVRRRERRTPTPTPPWVCMLLLNSNQARHR